MGLGKRQLSADCQAGRAAVRPYGGGSGFPGAGFKPAPTLTAGVEAGRAAKDAIALAIARNALTMVALHCSAKDVAADFHIMARRNSHDGLKLPIRPGSSKSGF